MKPILPREMLWTDKKTMDEFFELDPINEKFFEVLVTLKEEPFDVQIDDVKVFNEVYYQITRMVYEHAMPADIRKNVRDIKANIGWQYSAALIMSISYFMIAHVDDKVKTINFFTHKKIRDIFVGTTYWKPFEQLSKKLRKEKIYIKYDFKPHPVPVQDLADKYVHWDEITYSYSASALSAVFDLWDKYEDKELLSKLIDTNVRFKSSLFKERYYQFYDTFKKYVEGQAYVKKDRTELERRISDMDEKILLLEKEKAANQSYIKKLEANNARLRTLLDKKNETGKERRFTLVEIVEYCKNCVEWRNVESIVAMLNKLLRRIATDEDSELIDSIEVEFMNRKYGDTVMGDKNEFKGNSAHNTITLPSGMTPQEAMKLLQNKTEDDGEEG